MYAFSYKNCKQQYFEHYRPILLVAHSYSVERSNCRFYRHFWTPIISNMQHENQALVVPPALSFRGPFPNFSGEIKQNVVMAPMGVFTYRTGISERRQWRCQLAVLDRSTVFSSRTACGVRSKFQYDQHVFSPLLGKKQPQKHRYFDEILNFGGHVSTSLSIMAKLACDTKFHSDVTTQNYANLTDLNFHGSGQILYVTVDSRSIRVWHLHWFVLSLRAKKALILSHFRL